MQCACGGERLAGRRWCRGCARTAGKRYRAKRAVRLAEAEEWKREALEWRAWVEELGGAEAIQQAVEASKIASR